LLDVPRLPRSERSEGERVALVSVRDVGVGDRDTVFLHRSGVRQRLRRGDAPEAGESRDGVAKKIGQPTGSDYRCHDLCP
jgi:hypothetical protein